MADTGSGSSTLSVQHLALLQKMLSGANHSRRLYVVVRQPLSLEKRRLTRQFLIAGEMLSKLHPLASLGVLALRIALLGALCRSGRTGSIYAGETHLKVAFAGTICAGSGDAAIWYVTRHRRHITMDGSHLLRFSRQAAGSVLGLAGKGVLRMG